MGISLNINDQGIAQIMRCFLISLVFICFSTASGADPSFSKSKKILKNLYKSNPETFYCGCAIDYSKVKPSPDLLSCGYVPRKQKKRAKRLEWEHVVPVSLIASRLSCWENGGRKSCKKDKRFKIMESDLHNLVPSIGELNGDRSNRRFGLVDNELRVYGNCDFEINYETDLVEPRPTIRGDIARIWLYIHQVYELDLKESELLLFQNWDELDPVSDWECFKDKNIYLIQGRHNNFVYEHCN